MSNPAIPEKTCNHCKKTFPDGYDFCPHCGHFYRDQQITLGSLHREFWDHRWTDIKIFFLTTRDLLLQPGTVVKAYLHGDRSSYYNPFNYFLVLASFTTFLTLTLGDFDPESSIDQYNELFGNQELVESSPQQGSDSQAPAISEDELKRAQMVRAWQIKYLVYTRQYLNLFLMLTVPFFVLGIFWVFRKRGYNYGQTLILGIYAFSIASFFGLFLIPFRDPFAPPDTVSTALQLIPPIIYYAWSFKSFYHISFGKGVFKAILSQILYLGSFILFMGIFSLIVGLIIGVMAKFLGWSLT